jgi:citrate lyase subunit beta/citryl-CoA lyase
MANRNLLRSVLFCAADKPRQIAKAFSLGADCIVVDLEDAVSPSKKVEGRENIRDLLSSRQETTRAAVRINCPLTTSYGTDDLLALKGMNLDALLLPKVNCINSLNHILNKIEQCGIREDIPMWAMIETAKGVVNVDSIANSDRVQALIFGSNDLSKDLRSAQTSDRAPLLYSMSRVICAARAFDKRVVDGVHMNLNDAVGLESSCIQGKQLGFDGKSLIHPSQVAAANRCFAPSLEDVQRAKEIVAAYTAASLKGEGVCLLDGILIERLHVDEAEETLRVHEEINSESA